MGTLDMEEGKHSHFDLMQIALKKNPFCCARDTDSVLSLKSKSAKRWQICLGFVIFATAWVEFISMSMTASSIALCLQTLFDLFFGIDVILKFYTSYVDYKGVEISDRRMVIYHNLTTNFILDVIALLPLSQIEFLINRETSSAGFKFLSRFNKLIRLKRVTDLFNSKEGTIGSNFVLIRSLKYAFVIFLSMNTLTCVWYSSSCSRFSDSVKSLQCRNNTWAKNENFQLEVNNPTDIRLAGGQAGATAYYWVAATMTSVGYGDVTAYTMEEKAYSCLVMVAGICIFMAMALGGMASIETTSDQQRATYLHKYNVIVKYLNNTDCDDDLKKQAIGFYEYLWRRRKGEDISDVYKGLPFNFVSEISYASHKNMLMKAHLFDGLGSGFMRMVSLLIRPVLFLPQQIVVAKGDVAHQMFYILNGELEVLAEDDQTPILTLKSGKLFGELSLMYSLPRTATIRAVTHCDLTSLERRDLHVLLKQYPDISKKLHDRAKDRCDGAVEATDFNKPNSEAYSRRKMSYIEPSQMGPLRRSFSVQKSNMVMASHHSFHSRVHPHKPGVSPSTASGLTTVTRPGVGESRASLYNRQAVRSVHSVSSSVDVIDEEEEKGQPRCTFGSRLNRLKSTTIYPQSSILNFWQTFVMLIAVTLGFIHPYMACFHGYNSVTGDTKWLVFFIATYICDLILLIDILVCLRTGIQTPTGILTEFKDIVQHYCRSRHFVFGVVAVVPLECLVILLPDNSLHMKLFGFLKLNRVIKVLELPKLFSRREKRLEGRVFLSRTLKLLIYVVLSSHWAACILYVSACPTDKCREETWIVVYMESRAVDYFSAVSRYITALYFATATMTSTGYGDISAHTSTPRFLAGYSMIFGLFLYGFCISVQAATLANMDAPRVQYYEKYAAIKAYMESHHIAADLQERITNYLKIQWTKYGGIWSPGQKSMLHDIPTTLREDIVAENYYWMFAQCPVFAELDVSFIRVLATRLVSYTFSPGDIIVCSGDFGKEMYMIRRGVCEYVTPGKQVLLAQLTKGQYFGDLSMLYHDYQMGTVRAKTHVEVLELSLCDFEEVLREFPLIQVQFKAMMEDKNKWMQIKANLKREIERVEQGCAERPVNIMAESTGLRQRGRRRSTLPNTKVFRKVTLEGQANEDYEQPFGELKRVYRVMARLLMRRTFMPGRTILTWWIRIQLLIACIEAVIVPFQMAFMYDDPFFYTLQYTVDLIALISLYLGLHMAYYDDKGILISHPVHTARQYLTTNFAIDLLGCFPFELLLLAAYHAASAALPLQMVALLRLTRLIQLYRLPPAFTSHESRIDRDVEGAKTLKFVLYVIIFNNILTCLLYLLACPPKVLVDTIGGIDTYTNPRGDRCIAGSWLSYSEDVVSVSMMYTVSLYWAVATSCSVGYGDITAHSNVEMAVALIVMVSGVLFYGYIIASIAASLANADSTRAYYLMKMGDIRKYMVEHEMRQPLQIRVMSYYDYLWERTQGVEPRTLFEGLPITLWEDIACCLYQDTLSKISWFKDTDQSFLRTLCRHVKTVIFRKGDYVCKKGDVGAEVFFIKSGMVDVVCDDGKTVFETLTTGHSFGEDAWLFKCTRPASVRARTNCDLFILTKEDLDFVLESYPYLKGRITRIAKAEMTRAQQMNQSVQVKEKDHKTMSDASRKERLENVKRMDPESGLSDADKLPPQTSNDVPVNVETSLRTTSKDILGDKTYSDPKVEQFQMNEIKRQESPEATSGMSQSDSTVYPGDSESDSNGDVNYSQNNMGMGEAGKQTSSQQNVNQNNTGMGEAGKQTSGQQNVNQNNTGDEGATWDSRMSLTAPSHASMLCSGLHLPSETDLEVGRRCCRTLTINPHGGFYWFFSQVMGLLGLLSCWLIIYEAGFQDHSTFILALNYFIDIFYILQIFIKFRLSFYSEDGDLVDSPAEIRKHYLSTRYHFALDLISAAPIEILAILAPSGTKMIVLSMLRLLRLTRVLEVNQYFKELEHHLNVNMLVVRLCKFGVLVTLAVHFYACLWYLVACPFTHCRDDSWIGPDKFDSNLDAYVSCVYWCLATVTSTGYGDISPRTEIEVWVSIITMVFGKFMFGIVLANIASTLANAETERVSFDHKHHALMTHMSDQDVPAPLKQQVSAYYNYLWHRNRGRGVRGLFTDTPSALRAEILLNVTRDMLESIPFFENAEDNFLRQIASKVDIELFLPGNFIAVKGDMGHEMFYIYRGEVEVVNEDNPSVEPIILSKGDIVGEVSLVYCVPRRVSLKARNYVDLFALSKTDLEEVVENFPEMKSHIQSQAQQRFHHILNSMKRGKLTKEP